VLAHVGAPHLEHFVHAVQERLVVMAHAARIVVQDVLQLRALLLALEQLVHLLLVLDDGEAHARVLQHEHHFGGHGVLVHGHRNPAQALRGGHGQYRRGRLSPMMARLSPRLNPSSARPQASARTSPAACDHVQVCQMPRSFSRTAGRSPRTFA